MNLAWVLFRAPSIDEEYDLLMDEDVEASYAPSYAPSFPTAEKSLDERLKHLDKTFQEYLFMLIDRRGLTDVKYVVENLEKALSLPGGIWNFGSGNDQITFDTVK